jgi:hypothetical protein
MQCLAAFGAHTIRSVGFETVTKKCMESGTSKARLL